MFENFGLYFNVDLKKRYNELTYHMMVDIHFFNKFSGFSSFFESVMTDFNNSVYFVDFWLLHK